MKEQSEFDKCNQDLIMHGTSIMFDGKRIDPKSIKLNFVDGEISPSLKAQIDGVNLIPSTALNYIPNDDRPNGVYKVIPGEWQTDSAKNKAKITKAMDVLLQLTNEERLEVFSEFCDCCGAADPKCQCGNDE